MDNRPGAKPPIDDSINRARTATEEASSDVKQVARDAASTVKETVKEQAGVMKDKAMGIMGDAQAKAADEARTASNTLRNTADNLNGELPWMKTALNKTADGFDHLTTALNRGDVGQVLNGLSDFARRQPALFLGLSVAAGFALARVGKTALEGLKPEESMSNADGVDQSVAPYAPVAEI